MSEKLVRFHIYRYQLLPINRYFQADLYGPKTLEELLENKNTYFQQALNADGAFKSSRTITQTQKLFERNNFFLYRVAANRSLNHETRDFKTEVIDNWPKILVAIWNEPDKQLIAIQHRYAAFQSTDAFLKILLGSVENVLAKNQLTVISDPLFEKHIFWDLVDRNPGRVQEVEFEIITPNMANISGSLSDDLKKFAKETNSIKNKITISADKSSALHVSHNNPTVNGLVDYSSQGGGNISIKLKGVKKKITTSKTIKEFSIEESSLIGEPNQIVKILKELLT